MTAAFDRLTTALSDRYRLERELGQGGMATVYLAQDLKHDRNVALKVLKPELAAVLGAERFVVEIKTTAALQHPHILPLFDSGTAEGFLYYVMPFIQGETLRAKLDRETQLGIDEAIKITTAVADALDYAHRQGVIHRDIKPENILLHDGRPMVADFGIALAVSAAAGGRMTETGLSLGTPHYMSPEQATGEREITGRTDIYSLGSVLYEMLTGNPPHTGASAQQIIMKIVTEDAAPVSKLRRAVPPNVAAAVAKSLEKLPADRFASAAEFAAALADRNYTTTGTQVLPSLARGARRVAPLALAGWLVAAVAGAFGLWSWLRPAPARTVLRYAMALPEDQPLADARGHRIAISPDGSRLAYVGRGTDGAQLWLRHRSQLRAAPIPGTDRAIVPFFSPDGTRIGYILDGNSELRVVTLTGAPPITVADSGLGADGATWSADGFIYFDGLTGGGTTGLVRVSPSGGSALEQVTTVDTARGEQDHFWPSALPEGRGVLFTIQKQGNSDKSDVAVLDTKSMTHRVLVQGLTARYAPSGHLLYVTAGGDLMAVPFDLDRLELRGEPLSLTGGVARRPFGAVDLAVSESGTLLYQAGGGETAPGEIVYVSRDGSVTAIDSGLAGDFQSLALSRDGRRLAASKVEGTEQQVWVKQLPDGPLSKLTFEGNRNVRPVWSPDGNYVGYLGNEGRGQRMYRKRADGSSKSELVVEHLGRPINEAFWSRDGQWLVFRTYPNDIFARRTSGDTTTIPIVQSAFDEMVPSLSPDGRWLAYASNESGSYEVFVRPFPDAQSAKWQVSTAGGFGPHWSPDGRELLYWTAAGQLVSVPVLPGATFVAGQRQTLRIDGLRFLGDIGAWDVTPDGKRFLGIRSGSGASEERELIVVENAAAELSAPRAP